MPSGSYCDYSLETVFSIALDYTRDHLSYLKGCRPASEFDFNRSTSAGVPFNRKYKNKGETLDNIDLCEQMMLKHIPIWSVNDKKEFLPTEEVRNGKLRTTFAPDVVFLAHQKVFTTEANHRMQLRWDDFVNEWSRYGMCKQYNGFNRLFLAHAVFDIHLTGDGSGWDRVIPLLPYVWALREEFLMLDESTKPYFRYVAQNTCFPIVGIPDGTMYQRSIGNVSGSDSTTTDNTIAHIIVTYFFLILAAIRAGKAIPSRASLLENSRVSLYGDDSFDSLNSQFFAIPGESPEETRAGITEAYNLAYNSFGIVVKPTQFSYVTGKPHGLEFLGSTSLYQNGSYYPVPRLAKLCTSMTQTMCAKTHLQLCSTIFSLYDLTAPIPDPDCQRVAKALSDYASFVIQRRWTDGVSPADMDRLIQVSLHNSKPSIDLLTGYEGSSHLGDK